MKKLSIIYCLFILISISAFASTNTPDKVLSQDIKDYAIFIIPSNNIDPILNTISVDLYKYNIIGLYNLYNVGRVPYINLYSTYYNKSVIPKLESILEWVSANQKPFPIELTKLTQTVDDQLVFSIQSNPVLNSMSNNIVYNCSDLRYKNVTMPTWVKNYPNRWEFFKIFGSPNIFKDYNPHITIATTDKASALKEYLNTTGVNVKPQTITAMGIGIGEIDSTGQITNVIREYNFLP